ncbi:hypothetical protein K1T71_007527 [Dendrolimus kikuchii]|uniref:Uncharacterized protein n=1 Tax=Dendrolimus kikuchii TaxID=765133 RepID=A0ACC1D0R5_9NEOP|nr:hypothetical protein K1T71_007527 [Dendrolimus kikuchii]
MSEELLLAQAAAVLQAGFDTSGTALTFTIYEMAHKPQLQVIPCIEHEPLQGNILQPTSPSPETLRKYPPMGWLDRISSKEYRVDDKLTLPAGSVVYVNAVGLQSDPNHFPQPEQYDPDCFLPENERSIPPYTHIPFGDGPRNCIGELMRFAQQVMRFAVAKIFLAFRLEPLLRAPKPNEVQIEKDGLFMMPGEKLSVRFIPRPPLSLN